MRELMIRERKSGAKSTRRWKYPVVGQVRDVDGILWDVRDVRTTKHGFDLLFGSPAEHHGTGFGLPRLIATQPLYDYWDANRTNHRGVILDLPAGRTTMKRVRRRLGFNYFDDLSDFWRERIEDLQQLSPREFAARHNVNVDVVVETRMKLLGRRARLLGWWRKPEIVQILQSNISLKEVSKKLDISTSQAHRLRRQARQEYSGGMEAAIPDLLAA